MLSIIAEYGEAVIFGKRSDDAFMPQNRCGQPQKFNLEKRKKFTIFYLVRIAVKVRIARVEILRQGAASKHHQERRG